MEAGPSTHAHGKRLFLDAVDEAMQRSKDGKKLIRPKRRVGDVAMRQMALVERQQRVLRRLLRRPRGAACATCGHNGEVPAKDLSSIVAASNDVTNQVAKLTRAIRDNAKAEREAFGKLTEDELKSVFRTQLLRIGSQLDEDERRILLSLWFGEDVALVLLRGPAERAA